MDESRKQFLVWYQDRFELIMRSKTEAVRTMHEYAAWEGWQESRAYAEVSLPSQSEYDDPLSAYNAINDCAEAIRAAGIKVKE